MKKGILVSFVLMVVAMMITSCGTGTFVGQAIAGEGCSATESCEVGLRCGTVAGVSNICTPNLAPEGDEDEDFATQASAGAALVANPTLTDDSGTADNLVGDAVSVYNWRHNGVSITALNMPFVGVGNNDLYSDNARDYSGHHANHGTVINADAEDTTPSWDNGIYELGADDYIRVADDSSLDRGTDDFTIELDYDGDCAGTLLSHRETESPFTGYELTCDDGQLTFSLDFGAVPGLGDYAPREVSVTATEGIVTVVVDRDAGMAITTSAPEDGSRSNNNIVEIPGFANVDLSTFDISAAAPVEIGRGFVGYLGYVRIYDRALTGDMIDQLFDSGLDTIVAAEATIGTWTAEVTPNDGVRDGAMVSDDVEVGISMSVPDLNGAPTFTALSTRPGNFVAEACGGEDGIGGSDTEPDLTISGLETAESIVVVMDDLDYYTVGSTDRYYEQGTPMVHWVYYQDIGESEVEAMNDVGSATYYPPCPPAGGDAHDYRIRAFALDDTAENIGLSPNLRWGAIEAAITGHELAEADALYGTSPDPGACEADMVDVDGVEVDVSCDHPLFLEGAVCLDGTCALAVDAAVCGDGVIEDTEECDEGSGDGVTTDGCADCVIADGWACPSIGGLSCISEPSTLFANGASCSSNGQCASNFCDIWTFDGRCVPAVCGDGHRGGTETTAEDCDDGNEISGDGCHECSWECGDGTRDTTTAEDDPDTDDVDETDTYDEECDDGDQEKGDGCSSTCHLEGDPWTCVHPIGDATVCTTVCGDGISAGDEEECDGGNNCVAPDLPNECTLYCGNGRIDEITNEEGEVIHTEECDPDRDTEGELNDVTGCTDACMFEVGYICDGDSSSATTSCSTTCGDDITAGEELCDGEELCAAAGHIGLRGNDRECMWLCGDDICDASIGETTVSCEDDCGYPPVGPQCGNGVVDDGEDCDLGDIEDGDGCDSNCQDECGDGLVDNEAPYTEVCDDGGEDNGCSDECTVEVGFSSCSGQPSVCCAAEDDAAMGRCVDSGDLNELNTQMEATTTDITLNPFQAAARLAELFRLFLIGELTPEEDILEDS